MGHQTALHRAAAVGNLDAISALVHGGCALDLQDKEGNTALHEVSWHGFSACVKVLVKAGADVQVKNKAGNTPLHLACQNGHFQSARVLLLGGALPDSKNNAGDTCLHISARYNHLAMIKILLGSFCSVAEKNQIGDTALHVAASLNHKKAVNLLLEAGADTNIRNNTGHTALDKAQDHNNRDLAILLAKSSQVQRFARGKTVRKRRDVLRAQRRTQSLPRAQTSREKDCTEVAEDTNNSDQVFHGIQPERKTATLSPCTRRKIRSPRTKLEHVSRREYQLHERGSPSQKLKHSSPSSQEEDQTPGKAYQLYTLYRDRDGQIKQAPAKDCHCKPLIKTLEKKLKATKMEMRSEIHTVQEEMNCRLGRIEQKHKHQVKVLEKLAQERTECHYRINQRATLESMEGERKQQVAAANAVKSWCMSKIQDLEVRMPADTQYYKLLRSPSADHSLVDSDPEGVPLLSLVSEESSSSLATYVNVLPSPGPAPNTDGKSLEFGDTLGRRYFEMKLNGSSDDYSDYLNLTAPSMVKHKPLSRKLATADARWHGAELQEVEVSKPGSDKGDDLCASSSLSTCSQRFNDSDTEAELGPAWKHGRHLKDRVKAHHARTQQHGTMKTLEVFSQRPPEASFIQERANLHAMEVTQRFFETVSTQLERWYERKILEAQKMSEQKALQDRASLMEKIIALEEELQRLRTDSKTNS
ncbi:ankyrin repeat domain-containing protein 6 isoform X1 [Pimephales promelas]|uniref:ankyrin repeat domain-containing protein 6 isoform X1 n=1 Tax=Pimephales promelas TaxID=90988 RepID=UPI001955663F|nr:ankyrin repeat domain-containing protein 6 isoform X1 [Pimephales promelas]XP_039527467.1 ankyrin repeat domain-containing protein 6 isoform X1 [Pimephales promelas]XP_039527473.1 ankyrin repeat domain-containing protein 6 isoform X1 [Pimephales promelas]KAG1972981.1 ankyrin repeat domain-containing protein [Pimephales promelas]KAG1972984.1 ankyrin repeat domain-containing protein [Pimephales promelas]